MPLLGNAGTPVRFGNSLVLAPRESLGCVCCTRYDCVQGGVGCQQCIESKDGPYETIEDCEAACDPSFCVWCVEETREGPCGTNYVGYRCVQTRCDENGDCILPNEPVVSGPIKVRDIATVDCDADICPAPPDPPLIPECCDVGDCPCCHACIDGVCVECPEGYVCVDCQCIPIDEAYFCCQGPTEYGSPPPDPYCQRGPCPPPSTTVGGPYDSYSQCCLECGCRYSCDSDYICRPDVAGPHPTYEECVEQCDPPPNDLGACCYTIAPMSDDNFYNNPPFPFKCAAVRGCFGVMTHEECAALATDTGTTTVWEENYDTCDLCPTTASHVCCYPDPDNPCETLCDEADEHCCEAMGGKDYVALRTCEDRWPSGLSACREEACVWPLPKDEWFFEAVLRYRAQEYVPAPPNGDPPCIKPPQWAPDYPEKIAACDYRWVRDLSRCSDAATGLQHWCVRYRLYVKRGVILQDITPEAVLNLDDMECCYCQRNNNWAECQGDECNPLPFFADPETDCLP